MNRHLSFRPRMRSSHPAGRRLRSDHFPVRSSIGIPTAYRLTVKFFTDHERRWLHSRSRSEDSSISLRQIRGRRNQVSSSIRKRRLADRCVTGLRLGGWGSEEGGAAIALLSV